MKIDRTIKPLDEMTEEIASTPKSKIYKAQSDEHKSDSIAVDINRRLIALRAAEARGKVDINNLDEVKARTELYLEACSNAGMFPSIQGLASHGFGISRQALNQYRQRNSNAVTDYLAVVCDVISDIIVGQALYNNANPAITIFTLKNNHSWTDTQQVEVFERPAYGSNCVDVEALRQKYIDSSAYDVPEAIEE